MAKIPAIVENALKKVEDPHTGQKIYDMKMLKEIKITGKKVSMKLVPPGIGCAYCGMISQMVESIKKELKDVGYEASVEIGF